MATVVFLLVTFTIAVLTVIARKLTVTASIAGCMLATGLFLGTEWSGLVLMAAFFALATLATSRGKQLKRKSNAEPPRNTGQVLANAGLAGLLGFVCWRVPSFIPSGLVLIAAAFSSATADTVSSEMGTVYGKRFYDVLSFKPGQRGADGVVSLEGFVFGLMGSSVIAFVYAAFAGWGVVLVLIIIAGTIGNLTDSYLGALLERKGWITNNAVNFLNTVVAVTVMWLLR